MTTTAQPTARLPAVLAAVVAVLFAVGTRPSAAGPPPPTAATGPTATSRPATAPSAYVERLPGTEVTFAMVSIPAGRFMMGSPADEPGRREDEGPQAEVEVDALYVAEREVDWAAYNEFADQYQLAAIKPDAKPPPADRLADAVTYPTPIYDIEAGPIIQRMGGRVAGRPAVGVSRYAARQYAKWLSKRTGRFYRLPTEAEWEYACRAGSRTAYSFGNDPKELDGRGWYEGNSAAADGDPGVRPTATSKPNAWGLYDLHGNVGEWVVDAYDAVRYATLAATARPVRWDEAVNWPTTRYPGVVRGGGYESEARGCRSAARFQATIRLNSNDPCSPKSAHWESSGFWVGFRVVSPVREPAEAEKRRFWAEDQDEGSVDSMRQDRQIRELVGPGSPVTPPPAGGPSQR
jgi:formylglycine-generating enzyme required for sulfatase activity